MSRKRYWVYSVLLALFAIYFGAMDRGQLLPQTLTGLAIVQIGTFLLIYARAKTIGKRSPWLWAVLQCLPFIGPAILVWMGLAGETRPGRHDSGRP